MPGIEDLVRRRLRRLVHRDVVDELLDQVLERLATRAAPSEWEALETTRQVFLDACLKRGRALLGGLAQPTPAKCPWCARALAGDAVTPDRLADYVEAHRPWIEAMVGPAWAHYDLTRDLRAALAPTFEREGAALASLVHENVRRRITRHFGFLWLRRGVPPDLPVPAHVGEEPHGGSASVEPQAPARAGERLVAQLEPAVRAALEARARTAEPAALSKVLPVLEGALARADERWPEVQEILADAFGEELRHLPEESVPEMLRAAMGALGPYAVAALFDSAPPIVLLVGRERLSREDPLAEGVIRALAEKHGASWVDALTELIGARSRAHAPRQLARTYVERRAGASARAVARKVRCKIAQVRKLDWAARRILKFAEDPSEMRSAPRALRGGRSMRPPNRSWARGVRARRRACGAG